MSFPKETLKQRRKQFIELMEVNSAALFLSAQSQHRNSDVEQKFRQDSSFWYLSSFNEPDSALLIIKTAKENISIIFSRAREKEKEIWTGRRAGPEGAKEISGVDQAHKFTDLEEQLEKHLTGIQHFYFDYAAHHYRQLGERLLDIARGKRIQKITSTQNLIGELRLFKSQEEIALMKKAAQITTDAHKLAMKAAKEGVYEYAIEALIEGYFREQGAGWAYSSIVAGGPNATILHYVNNDQALKKGELLLIDAGCEKDYYACDITRTFPVASKFSSAQKQVYELVLQAQHTSIEQCKAKAANFDSVHNVAVKLLAQGLIDLKLLTGSLDEVVEKKTFRKFYMHRTSHWLGLDVHDVGSYQEPGAEGKSRVLKPGMVLTVEPGLYFDAEDESIPSEFRGIGVRIEDDVLITKNGVEVLTAALEKEVHEIEEMVSS